MSKKMSEVFELPLDSYFDGDKIGLQEEADDKLLFSSQNWYWSMKEQYKIDAIALAVNSYDQLLADRTELQEIITTISTVSVKDTARINQLLAENGRLQVKLDIRTLENIKGGTYVDELKDKIIELEKKIGDKNEQE